MTGREYQDSGAWFDVRGDYQRLLALARRRLVGHEHHAEDVVSRALIKWTAIPPEKRAAAHIEQVIKTEAYSVLRSEARLKQREERVARDRTTNLSLPDGELERRLLRCAVAEVCRSDGVSLTTMDIEVFELLLAGYSLSAVVLVTDLSRHEVKKIRAKWRVILSRVIVD